MRLLPESANMFSSAARTIVLTTKMPPNPTIKMASRNFPAYASPEEDSGSDGGGPRKRRRLTHLTPDEKLMRRKMKNRVAAQTARDRKKAQMDDLQTKVTELMEENQRLQEENAAMRLQMEQALRRTWELEKRLGQANTLPSAVKSETESVRSAEGADSLPYEAADELVGAGHDFEHAALLDIMQQLESQAAQAEADETFASDPKSLACASGPGGVVGPSAEELESLNELITFDHQYHKADNRPAQESSTQVTMAAMPSPTMEQAVLPQEDLGMDVGLEGYLLSSEDTAMPSFNVSDLDALLAVESMCGASHPEEETSALALQAEAKAAPAVVSDHELKKKVPQGGRKRKASNPPAPIPSPLPAPSPVPSAGYLSPACSDISSAMYTEDMLSSFPCKTSDFGSASSPSCSTASESLSPLNDVTDLNDFLQEDYELFPGMLDLKFSEDYAQTVV